MTFGLREHNIRAIVVDIEGTTTPITFVYDVLFPYARRALPAFVREHLDAPELRETWQRMRDDWAEDVARGEHPPEPIVLYAEWLMDRDRKAPGLKALQGHIWKRGYDSGQLKGEVFADVPDAFTRWRSVGTTVAIYSSGSVLAQQLLFGASTHGDLRPLIDAYFDTAVGPKTSPDSYRRIADALGCSPAALLFISDTRAEIDAAQAAGCTTLLCTRTPADQTEGPGPQTISTFSSIR